jgi:hypothetical protein
MLQQRHLPPALDCFAEALLPRCSGSSSSARKRRLASSTVGGRLSEPRHIRMQTAHRRILRLQQRIVGLDNVIRRLRNSILRMRHFLLLDFGLLSQPQDPFILRVLLLMRGTTMGSLVANAIQERQLALVKSFLKNYQNCLMEADELPFNREG